MSSKRANDMETSLLPPVRQRRLSAVSVLSAAAGLFLLLLALQVALDWRAIRSGGEGYVVVNKPVSVFNTFGLAGTGFSDAEMRELEALSAVDGVGGFLSNDFGLSLGSSRLGFRTEAFFESVPDGFVDVDYPSWSDYRPGDAVPIILSADYLALYNFGFAPSQGLPQISPSSVGLVTLDINIRGNNGRNGRLKGNVVGFSKRLNSIVVPEAFLRHANATYGGGTPAQPSRLILKVSEPQAPALLSFLNGKGYELSSNKAFGEEMGRLVASAVALVALIGGVVLLLSLMVLYLAYRLSVEERLTEVRVLYALGHTPAGVATYFERRLLPALLVAWGGAVLLTQVAHIPISFQIRALGFDSPTLLSLLTWLFASLLLAALWGGMRVLVRRSMRGKYV